MPLLSLCSLCTEEGLERPFDEISRHSVETYGPAPPPLTHDQTEAMKAARRGCLPTTTCGVCLQPETQDRLLEECEFCKVPCHKRTPLSERARDDTKPAGGVCMHESVARDEEHGVSIMISPKCMLCMYYLAAWPTLSMVRPEEPKKVVPTVVQETPAPKRSRTNTRRPSLPYSPQQGRTRSHQKGDDPKTKAMVVDVSNLCTLLAYHTNPVAIQDNGGVPPKVAMTEEEAANYGIGNTQSAVYRSDLSKDILESKILPIYDARGFAYFPPNKSTSAMRAQFLSMAL